MKKLILASGVIVLIACSGDDTSAVDAATTSKVMVVSKTQMDHKVVEKLQYVIENKQDKSVEHQSDLNAVMKTSVIAVAEAAELPTYVEKQISNGEHDNGATHATSSSVLETLDSRMDQHSITALEGMTKKALNALISQLENGLKSLEQAASEARKAALALKQDGIQE
jgi:predicted subunit of tRNA(5-methylaminomethyl-2-thiouridylate) methyltransferase